MTNLNSELWAQNCGLNIVGPSVFRLWTCIVSGIVPFGQHLVNSSQETPLALISSLQRHCITWGHHRLPLCWSCLAVRPHNRRIWRVPCARRSWDVFSTLQNSNTWHSPIKNEILNSEFVYNTIERVPVLAFSSWFHSGSDVDRVTEQTITWPLCSPPLLKIWTINYSKQRSYHIVRIDQFTLYVIMQYAYIKIIYYFLFLPISAESRLRPARGSRQR